MLQDEWCQGSSVRSARPSVREGIELKERTSKNGYKTTCGKAPCPSTHCPKVHILCLGPRQWLVLVQVSYGPR